jgi:hypothetical protein
MAHGGFFAFSLDPVVVSTAAALLLPARSPAS